MYINFSFLYLFVFLLGIILTIPISQLISNSIFQLLKYVYRNNNNINDRKTLYSCWAGIPNGNILYITFTFFFIFMNISAYFNKNIYFVFFSITSLIFFVVVCWNSLTRIELTSEYISIYKTIFGTETEVYKFNLTEIKSITTQLTMGNFLLGGFHNWLTINLTNGNQIVLAAPEQEEINILLSFLKENKDNKIEVNLMN